MKKTTLLLSMAFLGYGLQAQIQVPPPSPASTLTQQVGLTEVTVEYSRPSKKGRTIFGNLVPYGEIWRTGANMNTTIQFSDNVVIDGTTLEAGKYAVYTKPQESNWEVYFYTDTENGGLPEKWDETKVAAKASVPVYKMPVEVETFTITLDDLHNNGATLGLLWSDTYVGVPFTVPTAEKAMASIENVMAGPNAFDYYSAAAYYHEEGKDIQKAKEWIDKAAEMNGAFWILRRKSLIYAQAGDKKGAIEAARKSLAAAQAEGNKDYVKMNEDSLKEWGAL